MGLLTPNKNERLLLQRMFEEKCRMIGVEGFYYEVKDFNLPKTGELDQVRYFDPIAISFLFEDMPNPKTLRNLHWWDDNDETTPPIAYLPWHVNQEKSYELKPTVGSKIELPDPLGNDSRFYEIQEVNANTLYLVYSIVKPLRETVEVVKKVVEPIKPDKIDVVPSTVDPAVAPNKTDYQIINRPEPRQEPKRPESGYTFLNVDGRNRR